MNWLSRMFFRRRLYSDLSSEMTAHLHEKIDALVASGMSREEAARTARREFGNVALHEERSREVWSWPSLENFFADVRFAFRMLRKSPGFTVVAVLTLALGIGANTAIFSLINAVMLRSLPIRDPQHLLILKWSAAHEPNTNSSYNWSGCPGVSTDSASTPAGCTFSYPMFEQLRSRSDIFSDFCTFIASQPEHLTLNGSVSMANGFLVSGDFFATLGTRAILGRTLRPADDQPNSQPAAMLSYAFWKSRFGGDPAIVGKSILLEKTSFTVIGIASPGFTGIDPGRSVDVWMPLAAQYIAPYFPKRTSANSTWLEIMARLKHGVSRSQAQSALSVLFANATTAGPEAMFTPNDSPRIELINAARGLTSLRGQFSQPLFALMACVGIILLIACANVGGLFLARASSRRQEMAMRLTLGATRGRLARQLLTESLLTSFLGAALGILLAYWSASALAAFLSANWYSSIDLDVRPDTLVLVFTIGIGVLAAALFGLAPALQGTRVDLTPALKGVATKGPTALFASRRPSFGGMLVVAQVALSIVVLAGAGLLVRTLINLEQMNVGFETDHLLLFSVDMTMAGHAAFDNSPRVYQLHRALQMRLAALPGVTSATYSMVPLLSGGNMTSDFKIPGAPASSAISADELTVGPGFFETMRIPLLSGRTFTHADFTSSANPQPTVINQSFAKKFFGSENPLGHSIADSISTKADWQVVGVVGDAKYNSLREAILPTIYTLQKYSGADFELRTKASPKALIPLVRDAINQVNSSLLLSHFKTQTEQIDQLLYQERLVAGLSSLFAALSLLLACIGLYGLLSYDVARRTRELGIRMALGAQRRDLLRLVIRQGISLALIGSAIGIGAAIGVTRFVDFMLYGVHANDPLTIAAVSLLLLGVSLLGCYIPARRAMRVDPMVALRHE